MATLIELKEERDRLKKIKNQPNQKKEIVIKAIEDIKLIEEEIIKLL